MDNIQDIVVFVRVVEKQSFTAAARELNLSASAVSRHVSRLEESLGVQLIRRSTRRLLITDIGADFYEHCARVILELDRAKSDAAGHNAEIKGLLRVHATLGVGQRLVAPAVSAFLDQYKDLTIDLTIGTQPANLLESGLDVVIRSARLSDSSLDCRELGPVRYSVCAAPRYLAKAGVPKRPQDLEKFNCLIHTGQPAPEEWRFHDRNGSFKVLVKGNLRTNNGVALYEAVKGGLGIARLPDYAATEDLAAGALTALFPDVTGWGRSIKAFYLRSRHQPAKLTIFLDFLGRFINERPFQASARRAG